MRDWYSWLICIWCFVGFNCWLKLWCWKVCKLFCVMLVYLVIFCWWCCWISWVGCLFLVIFICFCLVWLMRWWLIWCNWRFWCRCWEVVSWGCMKCVWCWWIWNCFFLYDCVRCLWLVVGGWMIIFVLVIGIIWWSLSVMLIIWLVGCCKFVIFLSGYVGNWKLLLVMSWLFWMVFSCLKLVLLILLWCIIVVGKIWSFFWYLFLVCVGWWYRLVGFVWVWFGLLGNW